SSRVGSAARTMGAAAHIDRPTTIVQWFMAALTSDHKADAANDPNLDRVSFVDGGRESPLPRLGHDRIAKGGRSVHHLNIDNASAFVEQQADRNDSLDAKLALARRIIGLGIRVDIARRLIDAGGARAAAAGARSGAFARTASGAGPCSRA